MSETDKQHRWWNWFPVVLLLAGLCLLPLFFVLDRSQSTDALSQIKKSGKLRVLTINGPNTYFEKADSPAGLEYELIARFADFLDVDFELEVADSLASLIPKLLRGDAHLAAAGITITDQRNKILKFSRPYHQVRQQVVYLRGQRRPRRVNDLIGRQILVVAGSSARERLAELKVQHPDLHWVESSAKDAEELLAEVWSGSLELTIADSQTVALVQQHLPKLRVAFDLPHPENLAWAFPVNVDDSLFDMANAFLEAVNESRELNQLIDRYYGAVENFDYLNVATYRRRIFTKLPTYQPLFKAAAQQNDLDWRLLAAQSYQESQWNPNAVSPTGVRGIMQLTQVTATRFDIANREDPQQSILGGARYLRNIMDRLPDEAKEPDRTWLALASYNVGLGHLRDAQLLAQRANRDPNKWADVKQFLPLLSVPKWYKQTKHGYARGHEPVNYVTRIRSFYEILLKIDQDRRSREPPPIPDTPGLMDLTPL